MDPLSKLLSLPEDEKKARGLVYTPHEIFQQPLTWRRTFEEFSRVAADLRNFLDQAGFGRSNPKRPVTLLIGAGTSDYIGRSLAALLRRKWGSEASAVPSTDLLTEMDDYILPDSRYLWISFSRSGQSSEGVAVIEAALDRYPEIHHLIVTCNRWGHMAREFSGLDKVFHIVLDDEVNDRGLAMTSSFSNMVVGGQCLAHIRELSAYDLLLDEMISAAQSFIPTAAETAQSLAAEDFNKICFLGTGPLQAVAIESALKVLELTAGKVVTFGESFLGVRHGPLSAIDERTLAVAFLSGDKRRKAYELDLLREIRDKRLAGKMLAVIPRPFNRMAEIGETGTLFHALRPDFPDYYRPPVEVILGQLLGLFLSLRHGLRPDTPSPTGAISRVVSEVVIH
jgi:tagatose-6-phosphate ketose/aldose isomerase